MSLFAILPDLNRALQKELIFRVAVAKTLALTAAAVLIPLALLLWGMRKRARGFALASLLTVSPIGLGALVYADMVWIEPNWIQTRQVTIRHRELGQSLAGLRLVHISDLHVGNEIPWRIRQMVRQINDLRPDAIFITGDFVNSRGGMEQCLKALDRLKAPRYGIWAVPGNTDEIFYSREELIELCRQHGITLLVDDRRRLSWGSRAEFCLAGVDDPTYGRSHLSEALGGLSLSLPVLLLGHAPSDRLIEQAAARRVALLLAGHTHGGQVGIPWIREMSDYANRTAYIAGRYRIGQTNLYVNRGIGTKTRPWRLLCRPEITLLEVKP